MAFPLPPWLQVNPNDFLAAVNSGAQAGLHVAGLRNQAQQSADRLAEAANEASANRAAAADRAAEQIALHSWEAGERLRQQAKELADLSAYREGQLGNRAAQLSLQAVEDARKEAHDAATHQLGRDRLALDERRAKALHITKSGSDIFGIDQDTGDLKLLHRGVQDKLTPTQKLNSELLKHQIMKLTDEANLLDPTDQSTSNQQKLINVGSKILTAKQELKKLLGPSVPVSPITATAVPTAPAAPKLRRYNPETNEFE